MEEKIEEKLKKEEKKIQTIHWHLFSFGQEELDFEIRLIGYNPMYHKTASSYKKE